MTVGEGLPDAGLTSWPSSFTAQHSTASGVPPEVLQFDSDDDEDNDVDNGNGGRRKEGEGEGARSASHASPPRRDPRALSSIDLIARLNTPAAPAADHRSTVQAHAVDSANRKRKLVRGGLASQLLKVCCLLRLITAHCLSQVTILEARCARPPWLPQTHLMCKTAMAAADTFACWTHSLPPVGTLLVSSRVRS